MRFFLFLFLVSFTVHAQENDTLFSRIISVQNDTERVNQLYKRGFSLRNQNPQWAFEYGKRAESEALKTKSKKHIAKSYNLLGVMFYKRGNYRTALRYHKKALALREECRDILGIAVSQTNLGNVYADLSLWEQAEDAYLKAIEQYKHLDEKSRIADCLMNVGVIKHHQKQYRQAIEYYKMAAEITPMNDYNTQAIYLTNMGEAFIAMTKAIYLTNMEDTFVAPRIIEKGIAYNQDALKLRIMADNYLETADNYLNLGEAYLATHDFIKSKYYLDTAFYLANKNDYFELRYRAYLAYAHYYEQTKDFEKALIWLKKYRALSDSIQVIKEEETHQFDFDENAEHYEYHEYQGLQNVWLLVSVFALLIFIPFYFIRFKR